jgi:pyruvate carboxylase
MSGVVVEMRVHIGSVVKKGDPIAVLSAMKMEMVISAPHGGKIDQIKVAEGVIAIDLPQLTFRRTLSILRT